MIRPSFNSWHLAIVSVFLLFAFSNAESDGDVYTIKYHTSNFDEEVILHNHFVMFYAPWCGHCKRLHPTWEELAEMLNGEESSVKIAKVDCTVDGDLCNAHDVTGYPTLKFFKAGSLEGIKFRGTRDLPSLTTFITEQANLFVDEHVPDLPSLTELTEDTFEKHVASGKHFVKFYAPWCGHCQKLAPIWDDLGKNLGLIDNVQISKIDCTQHRNICNQFDIKGYPTLLWIEDGRKVEKYQGQRSLDDLKSYVTKMADSSAEVDSEDDNEVEKEEQSNVITLSGENFDEGIARGFTFVKFFAPWCGHCKRLAPTWDELGKKFIGHPEVDIVKVDCTLSENKELCNAQEVEGFPSVFLFKNGKRISEYNGNRSLQDLYEFIQQHLSSHDELMACNNAVTLLGYEDEPVTEKNAALVNFTTNKVGGLPDLPSRNVKTEAPPCPLCQLPRLLVVQIYAPIENITYQRTLYVFACINPNCWNQSESWICLRAQSDAEDISAFATGASAMQTTTKTTGSIDWCTDADDWDDDNSNFEENGNVINKSDDDDESASLDESLRVGFDQLGVDDKNANGNIAEAQGGAVGSIHSPTASAEIEGAEGEVVSIDTPTFPHRDIGAILHEVANLPHEIFQRKTPAQFESFFMSVYEEQVPQKGQVDRHVRELLQEYQANNEDANFIGGGGGGGSGDGDATLEKYEKSRPAHGDKMFHYYLMKIRQNPGHFLRYNRMSNPLLLYPPQDHPKKCSNCQGDVVFEFQLLPTIIPLLQVQGDYTKSKTRLEFGNVLIFTCKSSCWTRGNVVQQEWVLLQSENI